MAARQWTDEYVEHDVDEAERNRLDSVSAGRLSSSHRYVGTLAPHAVGSTHKVGN